MIDLSCSVCFILLIHLDNFPGYVAEPIQGGQHDACNEVNWQVSFQRKWSTGVWHHSCGGSIVSNKHIVTAAHCFIYLVGNETQIWDRTTREETRIVIGTNDLHSPVNSGFEMKIDKVIVPKAYEHPRNKSALADIAVIKLRGRIDLSINRDKYRRIDLFDPKNETERKKYDDQEGFVAGFGASNLTLGPDGKTTYVTYGLRNILPVHLTDYKCPKKHGLRCIQYVKSGKELRGTCNGDSGGPLYYRNGNKFELVGVISGGPKDCDIRESHGKVERITFIPDYKEFLDKAKVIKANTTFSKMSIKEFEKSGVDYVVLPNQAALARKYYRKRLEKNLLILYSKKKKN